MGHNGNRMVTREGEHLALPPRPGHVPPQRPTSAPRRRLTRRTRQRFNVSSCNDSSRPADPSALPGPPPGLQDALSRISPHFAPRPSTCCFVGTQDKIRGFSALTVEECGVQWSAMVEDGAGR